MGKLKDLLDEYKKAKSNSTEEHEIAEKIWKIVDWMKENGHLDKPFKLPRKRLIRGYGIDPDVKISNFVFFSNQFCPNCKLLITGSPLVLEDGRIPWMN